MDLTSSDEEITQPAKKVCSNCIIHCSDEVSDSLVTLKSLDSWQTLRRAAEIRQHGPVLSIAETLKEGEMPNVQYHRKCRSIFTINRLLIQFFLNVLVVNQQKSVSEDHRGIYQVHQEYMTKFVYFVRNQANI